MQPFPHHYTVTATGNPKGDVVLSSDLLPDLPTTPPAEFDGPGDRWSPETLVVAAVVDCFVLTFRAIANLAKLPWKALRCEGSGTVERTDRITQFTSFALRAALEVHEGANEEQAHRLLQRAKQTCLVTSSLKSTCHLEAHVLIVNASH